MGLETTNLISPVSFAEHFWGKNERGADMLAERLRHSKQTCEELRKMLLTRAQIEEEYGERLLKLASYPLGTREIGTFGDAINSVQAAIETTARAHLELVQNVRYNIEQPLSQFILDQREVRKAQQSLVDSSKGLKDLHTANVLRAREIYEAECSKLYELESSLETVDETMREQHQDEIDYLKKKIAGADEEYRRAAEVLAQVTEKWNSDWTDTCDVYQKLEEQRLVFLRNQLWTLSNVLSSTYVLDDQSCERVRISLESCDVGEDMQIFVDMSGTGTDIPEPISYQNFYASLDSRGLDEEEEDDDSPTARLPHVSRHFVQDDVPPVPPPKDTPFHGKRDPGTGSPSGLAVGEARHASRSTATNIQAATGTSDPNRNRTSSIADDLIMSVQNAIEQVTGGSKGGEEAPQTEHPTTSVPEGNQVSPSLSKEGVPPSSEQPSHAKEAAMASVAAGALAVAAEHAINRDENTAHTRPENVAAEEQPIKSSNTEQTLVAEPSPSESEQRPSGATVARQQSISPAADDRQDLAAVRSDDQTRDGAAVEEAPTTSPRDDRWLPAHVILGAGTSQSILANPPSHGSSVGALSGEGKQDGTPGMMSPTPAVSNGNNNQSDSRSQQPLPVAQDSTTALPIPVEKDPSQPSTKPRQPTLNKVPEAWYQGRPKIQYRHSRARQSSLKDESSATEAQQSSSMSTTITGPKDAATSFLNASTPTSPLQKAVETPQPVALTAAFTEPGQRQQEPTAAEAAQAAQAAPVAAVALPESMLVVHQEPIKKPQALPGVQAPAAASGSSNPPQEDDDIPLAALAAKTPQEQEGGQQDKEPHDTQPMDEDDFGPTATYFDPTVPQAGEELGQNVITFPDEIPNFTSPGLAPYQQNIYAAPPATSATNPLIASAFASEPQAEQLTSPAGYQSLVFPTSIVQSRPKVSPFLARAASLIEQSAGSPTPQDQREPLAQSVPNNGRPQQRYSTMPVTFNTPYEQRQANTAGLTRQVSVNGPRPLKLNSDGRTAITKSPDISEEEGNSQTAGGDAKEWTSFINFDSVQPRISPDPRYGPTSSQSQPFGQSQQAQRPLNEPSYFSMQGANLTAPQDGNLASVTPQSHDSKDNAGLAAKMSSTVKSLIQKTSEETPKKEKKAPLFSPKEKKEDKEGKNARFSLNVFKKDKEKGGKSPNVNNRTDASSLNGQAQSFAEKFGPTQQMQTYSSPTPQGYQYPTFNGPIRSSADFQQGQYNQFSPASVPRPGSGSLSHNQFSPVSLPVQATANLYPEIYPENNGQQHVMSQNGRLDSVRPSLPTQLKDGTPIIDYVVAGWDYEAKWCEKQNVGSTAELNQWSNPERLSSGGAIMKTLGNETLKAELGRSTWKLLHTMTARYPLTPTPDERESLKLFILLLGRLYPCGECAEHFQKLIAKNPPQTSSRDAASQWACAIHNMVNEQLNKELFDCSMVATMYKCGCDDESVQASTSIDS
ncbi:hypothetical protein BZG36_01725 [Bifiguratus adelaidae]|uniref:Sulfhydryl oxidase n=1 Tax=Bifiguratus adelaidae TaxID=1938954 RepID=A0A261Y4L2_9FUNG|nr:hypothetical protein BZG36_01725 [Bifiguratus adelaidae]